ncbi:uncharacterized protein AB675_7723 [Cyphellophora attinorum]|uniref:Uncharacterized protein n=1 Tax=Cyphellophora attinorum TaxID=1664694 RepID=A0A0N0NMM2_9EURO|nr:uncharacterized protein AB675_7723 [Phialophora attinorum]KPI40369.1 hypothetical protein AB675_7723 [Phialophora attinorum]
MDDVIEEPDSSDPLSSPTTINSLPLELLQQIFLVNMPDEIHVVYDNTRTHSWNGRSQLCWTPGHVLEMLTVCKLWTQAIGPLIHRRVEVVVRTPEKYKPEGWPAGTEGRVLRWATGRGLTGNTRPYAKTGQNVVEDYLRSLSWSGHALSEEERRRLRREWLR